MKPCLLLLIFTAALSAAPILVDVIPQNNNTHDGGFPKIKWRVTSSKTDSIIIVRELDGAIHRDTVVQNMQTYVDRGIFPNRDYIYSVIGLANGVETAPSNKIRYRTSLIDVEYLLNSVVISTYGRFDNIRIKFSNLPGFEISSNMEFRRIGEQQFNPLKTFTVKGVADSTLLKGSNFELLNGYEFKTTLQADDATIQYAEKVEHFYSGYTASLEDLVDWSQFPVAKDPQELSALTITGNALPLWIDTTLLIREFDSSLTAISLSDPQNPSVREIIRGEFASKDRIWQIGNLLVTAELNDRKKLQFITAKFESGSFNIIDTTSYGDDTFTSFAIDKVAKLNDTLCAITCITENDRKEMIYLSRTGDRIAPVNYRYIDPMEGLEFDYIPGIDIITAKSFVGFADYHSSYVICTDTGNVITPLLVPDELIYYGKNISSGIMLSDSVFRYSRDVQIDTTKQLARFLKRVYESSTGYTSVLYTFSFTIPTAVAVNDNSGEKVSTAPYQLQQVNNNIRIEGLENKPRRVNIFSLNGKVLLSAELSKESNLINISSLAKGTYLIGIRGVKNHKSMVAKFVKQ